VALAALWQHAGTGRRGIGGQGQSLADARARGMEGLERGSALGIASDSRDQRPCRRTKPYPK
jgi:hypothetical protein